MRYLFLIILPLAACANLYVDNTPQDIYVIGDSMTHDWPESMAAAFPTRSVYGAGIGGTQSWEQVRTMDGVYIAYPQGDSITPSTWYPADDTIAQGTVTIRIARHGVKNSYFGGSVETYRSQWPERCQKVTTPTRVEVFNNGVKIGDATHNTFTVTTNYGSDINRLYKTAHGLSDGDDVALWVDDAARPARSNADYWQSAAKPDALIEYKRYKVLNSTADDFELQETAIDGTPLDLGSDATGTLICETGWTLDWEYDGNPWELTLRTTSDISDRLWVIQTTTNDVIPGDPGDDYQRWPTHTEPAIDWLAGQMLSHPKRAIYVLPTISHSGPNGGDGSDNDTWIHDVVIPYAEAKFGAGNVVNPYALAASQGAHLAEELALLADPEIPEALWIRGNPSVPGGWEAFATDQGDTYHRWVGPGFLPLHFRKGSTFSDGGHYDDDDGAQFVADAVADLINSNGW